MVYNQANKNQTKAENVSESVQSKMNRLSIKTFCAYLYCPQIVLSQDECFFFSFSEMVRLTVVQRLIHNYSFNLVLDIDECSSNSHSCDVNAVCNNTRGFYTCACKRGYSGDGKNCTGKL